MIDARQGFLLLLKFLHDPRILQRLLVQDFYDDRLIVKFLIAREIHDADAALADLLLDQVARIQRLPAQGRLRQSRLIQRRPGTSVEGDRFEL